MTLAEELTWRGFVNQTTFSDINEVNTPRTLYFGVDPSADSLTIGNLASVLLVRHFLDYGHKVILLVGGATGMIGDPDGKKQERELRNKDTVEKNVAALINQLNTLFDGKPFEVVNNNDWFKDMNYVEFLHKIGKHVSMTQLLDRDFVRQRIGSGGSGISYGEFSYSLIQGYDFLHLFQENGVTLQLAGADQWGNAITGASLIRKIAGGEAHVFTTPLTINKQTGVKFGKSEGGAIWLDPTKTSPYKFYQFWLNIDDETAKDMVKIYTLMKKDEVRALIAQHDENPGLRELQRALAYNATELIHGADRADAVRRASDILFAKESFELTDDIIAVLRDEIPTYTTGVGLIEVLVESGISKSNGDARRLISGNAISVNGEKVAEDMKLDKQSVVKKGKNNFLLVV